MRKGEETRAKILDAAEVSVLAKGFGGTSIDELIAETGITKSGFFYHFRDKNELAKALLERYVENDERIYDEIFSRARELADDPLQAFSAWPQAVVGTALRSSERSPRLPGCGDL